MPVALKLIVTKAEPLMRGQDHFWRVIRALGAEGRLFTAAQVGAVSDEAHRSTITTYLRRLEMAGYLAGRGTRRSASGKHERQWELLRGPEATPTVSRDGTRQRQTTAQQQMWNVMRGPMARTGFTYADLVAYGSTDDLAIPAVTAKSYIALLFKAGYLLQLHPGGPGKPALWRLRPAMNTGPQPPMALRAKLIFDQNRHRVVGDAIAEEVDP